MRGKARWGLGGAFVLMAAVIGCGGDDDAPPRDSGADIGTGGRAGAGTDAGRADSDATAGTGGATGDAATDRSDGSGGSSGTGGAGGSSGASGTGGSGGSGGSSGTGGAGGIAGAAGRDGGSDVSPDTDPPLDAAVEPDTAPIVDGAVDRADVGDGADGQSPPPNDVTDEVPPTDGSTGGDVISSDGSDAGGGDAGAGAADSSFDASDAPLCDDSNSATFDFYHSTYGCGHWFDANPNDNDGWITYDVGFHVDVATGLGWVVLAGSRNAVGAATACFSHTVSGLGDWRIPTIDDARSLAGGCAPTVPGGTCPIEDPGCLATICGQGPTCSSCTGGQGPNSGAYCKVDVRICSHFHTSSLCADCGDAGFMDWIYVPSNGHFLPFNSLSGIPTACVSTVPNGVPTTDGG